MVKAAHFGKSMRLNLWDGISLKNGRFSGRNCQYIGQSIGRRFCNYRIGMTDNPHEKFDKLLKAMSEGEALSSEQKKPSTDQA